MADKEFLLENLAGMLKSKRYKHSIRCADCAVKLARLYGADPEKAWIAGLTHDISRGQERDLIKEWAILDKGCLSDYEEQHFDVLHSYASAWHLKSNLGIRDEEILNAVRFHTCGSPDMDILAKVVFAADYLEPGRGHLSWKDREQLMTLSVDQLILTILDATEHFLTKNGITLSPDSRELYEVLTKR